MNQKVEQLVKWRDLSTGFGLDRATFGAVPINEAIAAADRFSAVAQVDSKGDDSLAAWAREYKELARVYSWFRDHRDSKTVADVLDALEQRKIDLGVVKLFFFDINDPLSGKLTNAAKKGYPGLAEALGKRDQEAVAESLERSNRVSDEV